MAKAFANPFLFSVEVSGILARINEYLTWEKLIGEN